MPVFGVRGYLIFRRHADRSATAARHRYMCIRAAKSSLSAGKNGYAHPSHVKTQQLRCSPSAKDTPVHAVQRRDIETHTSNDSRRDAMKLQPQIALTMLLALCAGTALATPPAPGPQALLPANRIVGLWTVTVTNGPCSGGPQNTFTALNSFNLGGTMNDTNVHPLTTRGPGQGIWQYSGYGQYRSRMQFFRFLPATGAFDGIVDKRETIQLNAQATQYTTTVYARILNADGSLRTELCGSAIGNRVGID
jgi:hypothetical protein